MLFKIFKIIKNHMVCWTAGLQMAVEGVELANLDFSVEHTTPPHEMQELICQKIVSWRICTAD